MNIFLKLSLAVFCISNISFSQNFEKKWKEIYLLENEGKIKDAYEKIKSIHKLSLNKKNDIQQIKSFIYKTKFEEKLNENETFFINIHEEIKTSNELVKAFLYQYYGEKLTKYYQKHQYEISRNKPDSITNNLLLWDKNRYRKEINYVFEKSYSNSSLLNSKKVLNFEELITKTDQYFKDNKKSLYQFFIENQIRNLDTIPFYSREEKINYNLLKTKDEFSKTDFKNILNPNFQEIGELFKKLEQTPETEHTNYTFERIKYFFDNFTYDEKLTEIIENLKKEFKNTNFHLQLDYLLAKNYNTNATKTNKLNQKALLLLENILKDKSNPKLYTESFNLKEKILEKSLSFEMKNSPYPGQKIRAYINYKNHDSLLINYYKILPENKHIYKNDSIVIDLINNKKPSKSFFRTLPNLGDYSAKSTEIMLEPFEKGTYLVVISAPLKNGNHQFAYDVVSSNNLESHEELINDKIIIYFRDKATGEPLKNTLVKTIKKTYESDINGKLTFILNNKESFDNEFSNCQIITNKDTITNSFFSTHINQYSDSNEKSYSKNILYLDKGIYRPGQKVYFKGIIAEYKNNKTSTVPNLSVKVEIENPNGEIIKSLELQTNEFGSYSGEFTLPINGVTGEYQINILEPEHPENNTQYYNKIEEEHSFWDNNYLENDYIYFSVEEYKKPSFEIKIDPLKNHWKKNDLVLLKGQAIGFAKNIISNADVKAIINDKFNIKTKTNLLGEFEIRIKTDTLDKTFNYLNFNISITDISGETISIEKNLNLENSVNNFIKTKRIFNENDKKEIVITSKDQNNFEITTRGILKIYKKNITPCFIPRRHQDCDTPILDSITFKKEFPFEQYKFYDNEKKLIKIIEYESAKPISLDFLKDGEYQLETSTKDSTSIYSQSIRHIEVKTKNFNKPNHKLFDYYINEDVKSNKITVTFKSLIDDLFITCFNYHDKGNSHEDYIIKLEKGLGQLILEKPKNKLNLYFFSNYDNYLYSDNYTTNFKKLNEELVFEIQTIRNKIEPGSTENWKFKILNSKLESEIVATMYDVSLDQLKSNYWDVFYFYHPNINFPNFSYYPYNNIELNLINSEAKKIDFKFTNENKLNWFIYENDNYFNSNLKATNKRKLFIGKILTLDNIPESFSIYKNSEYYTENDFYGYFYIEANKNDLISIASLDNTYYFKFKSKFQEINIPFTKEIKLNFDKSERIRINYKKLIPVTSNFIYIDSIKIKYESLYLKYEELSFAYESIPNEFLKRENNDLIISNESFERLSSSDNINEVVVTAMGIRKRKDAITSSAITYKKELTQGALPNVVKTITGKVSGLQITVNEEKIKLFSNKKLQIENKETLLIIDGIETNPNWLYQISNDDIENIESLNEKEGFEQFGDIGKNGVIIITTKKYTTEINTIKTRKDFKDTAFFYPHIKTDSEGKFSLEFTTPEQLTTWKLKMIGHNKNAEMGFLSGEIISQKDLMIIPNLPRFVRENDILTVTAKIANLTNETKTGIAKLILMDASTGNPIQIFNDSKEFQNFNCKAKGNIVVEWKIKIPTGLKGLQYKILAKSGNFTDGEENILPVLSNSIMVTEAHPVWIKPNTNVTYDFENLNIKSSTKENYKIQFNLLTNPIWSVIETLPYLQDFEHDCTEQTFSKYFANTIAQKIITDNPKVKLLLEDWKKNNSKLNQNENLKSTLLSETPWLIENDSELKKRMSNLLDTIQIKKTNEALLNLIKEKQSSSGGFSWFGKDKENEYITRHILCGVGYLQKLIPETKNEFETIVKKGISYLDTKFENNFKNKNLYNDLHYIYTRSFYLKDFPVSQKNDSLIKKQLNSLKENWLEKSLFEKTMLALALNRFNDAITAKKIIEHLRQSSILDNTKGMYWKENINGYYWYQSNIELQALIIEAFAEIDFKENDIEAMKIWLINNKQNKNWNTTKSSSLAINALLSFGNNWLESESKIEINKNKNVYVKKEVQSKIKESENGILNIEIPKQEIHNITNPITIENKGTTPVTGGIYYQYFENLDKIDNSKNKDISINKKLIVNGIEVNKDALKIGDLVTIQISFNTANDLEFVHIKDLRASCLEPTSVLSEYKYVQNTYYYMNTKDVATHFFFDYLPKGEYKIEYNVRVNNIGEFNDGIATLQSMYAPEYISNSNGRKIKTIK